jgi:hypothetical protein
MTTQPDERFPVEHPGEVRPPDLPWRANLLPRGLSGAAGLLFLVVGIVGLAMTGTSDFVGTSDNHELLVFHLNPLHSVVHIVVGALVLPGVISLRLSRLAGAVLLTAYGAAVLYGLLVAVFPDIDVLNLNVADNWLHFAAMLTGAIVLIWPPVDAEERGGVPPPARSAEPVAGSD